MKHKKNQDYAPAADPQLKSIHFEKCLREEPHCPRKCGDRERRLFSCTVLGGSRGTNWRTLGILRNFPSGRREASLAGLPVHSRIRARISGISQRRDAVNFFGEDFPAFALSILRRSVLNLDSSVKE